MQHGALPEDRKEDKEAYQNGSSPDQDLSPEAKKQKSYESRMNRVKEPQEDGFFNAWSKVRHKLREPLAEWLGVSPTSPTPQTKPIQVKSKNITNTKQTDNHSNDNRPLCQFFEFHL
jgi:hypothetical protein